MAKDLISFKQTYGEKGSYRKPPEVMIVFVTYTKDGAVVVDKKGTKIEGVTIALPPGMYITLKQTFMGYLLKVGEGAGHVVPITSQLMYNTNERI